MKKLVFALLLSLPFTALASPPLPPPGPERFERTLTPEQRERMERRSRVRRVVGLVEELDLTTAEALRIDEILRKFDERRRPLRDQVAESARILERASEGDSQALGQVDQAAQRIYEARAQMAQIDKEMYTALSRDLKPQQRARMAVYFARFDNENVKKRVVRKHKLRGELGPGPEHTIRFGMRMPPPGEHEVLEIEED